MGTSMAPNYANLFVNYLESRTISELHKQRKKQVINRQFGYLSWTPCFLYGHTIEMVKQILIVCRYFYKK